VEIVAIDLACDAKSDSVLRFVTRRNVDAKFFRPAAQRLGDGVMQARFRSRRQTEQMGWRNMFHIGNDIDDGGAAMLAPWSALFAVK
jgi:hypothetical protein